MARTRKGSVLAVAVVGLVRGLLTAKPAVSQQQR